jgi:hypothetical protein
MGRTPVTLLAVAALVVTLACKNSDVNFALGLAASNSKTLSIQAAGIYGPDDARTKRIQNWAGSLQRLKTDYANATTPEEQVKLLPTLNASLDFFDTDVLPFLKLSPTSYLIAIGIENALRLAANHFVKTVDKVQQVAPASANDSLKSSTGTDVSAESDKLRTNAKKHLRARDAKTGRFVTAQYAAEHPDTTVIERW